MRKTTHRARWFVWAGNEMIPHTAQMRGQWGYDVKCSCGEFETKTGGATRRYVREEFELHRLIAEHDYED